MRRLVTTLLLGFFLQAPSDPRAIVEETQKRSTSSSQHYEGNLQVLDEKSKVTEKRWEYDRIG